MILKKGNFFLKAQIKDLQVTNLLEIWNIIRSSCHLRRSVVKVTRALQIQTEPCRNLPLEVTLK
jgi:hypothetical protein